MPIVLSRSTRAGPLLPDGSGGFNDVEVLEDLREAVQAQDPQASEYPHFRGRVKLTSPHRDLDNIYPRGIGLGRSLRKRTFY